MNSIGARLSDRASLIQYGLTQSASNEPVGPKFLRITDIQGGRVDWASVPYCRVSAHDHEKYRLRPNDIVVARTGASTGENTYIHAVPDAVFASYLVRFQFGHPGTSRVVGEYMRTAEYFDYVAGCIGGSAQPNASAQTLAGAEFPFPPEDLANAFATAVKPLDALRSMNTKTTTTLAVIRDTLLPKLLSGEIHIREAEKVVEAHV